MSYKYVLVRLTILLLLSNSILCMEALVNIALESLDKNEKQERWFKAVTELNVGILKNMLTYKQIDINTTNNNGDTALHLSVRNNNANIVLFLLESGIDINIQNNNDETALHLAVFKQYDKIVKLLLCKRSDPNGKYAQIDLNIKDKLGWAVLHWIVTLNCINFFKLLLKTKIKINFNIQADKTKQTPLHLVNSVEMFMLLLKQGADLTLKNCFGERAEFAGKKLIIKSNNYYSFF